MKPGGRRYTGKKGYIFKVPGTGKIWWGILLAASFLIFLMMMFSGDKSLLRVVSLYRERMQLTERIEVLKTSNAKLTQQIENLKNGPKAFERIAREELGMVREDEIVYRFVSPSFSQKHSSQ